MTVLMKIARGAVRRVKRVMGRVPSEQESLELRRREKAERKRLAFETTWQHDGPVSRRPYTSYDEYVAHQSSKLEIAQDNLVQHEQERFTSFVDRFRQCEELASRHNVVCLGARLGTEVRALIELGHFAVGIDLNPGPGNAFVMVGDFHDLVFADQSVDAIYCNCLDHTFDLDKICGEMGRVLRPGGIALLDIYKGYEEGHYAGAFEAMHWPTSRFFAEIIAGKIDAAISSQRNLADFGQDIFDQFVLVKRGAISS